MTQNRIKTRHISLFQENFRESSINTECLKKTLLKRRDELRSVYKLQLIPIMEMKEGKILTEIL